MSRDTDRMNSFRHELNKNDEFGLVSEDAVVNAALRELGLNPYELRQELNKIPSEMGWMSRDSAVKAVEKLFYSR